MIIETDRLYLTALKPHLLKMWAEDIPALEVALNCTYGGEPMEGIFLDIVKGQLPIAQNDEANYIFHTFWVLIRKSDRIVVGSACFKDIPNENGEVEIGYGLGKSHEHSGYMTEAVQAMCAWALSKSHISHVIAETDTDNLQSQHVLKRCGFVLIKQNGTLWWRIQA